MLVAVSDPKDGVIVLHSWSVSDMIFFHGALPLPSGLKAHIVKPFDILYGKPANEYTKSDFASYQREGFLANGKDDGCFVMTVGIEELVQD